MLFNGAESALTGPRALKAQTDQKIRMFIGNGGPNLVSSFHVIGEIFDKVQYEGGTRFQENVQTTLIPAGGAATVEFHTEVPGNYVLVDHSIFRAFNKGALAILEVARRAARRYLLRQAARRNVYRRQDGEHGAGGRSGESEQQRAQLTKEQQIQAGEVLFKGTCSTCHQDTGQGIAERVPAAGQVRLSCWPTRTGRSASC